MGMEKRLLLDRITLHSRDIAPWGVKGAALVEANLADPGLSVGNRTAVPAGIAAHSIAIQFLPEGGGGFPDAVFGRQNVLQAGHICILRLFQAPKASSLPRGAQGTRGKPAQFASDFARWL